MLKTTPVPSLYCVYFLRSTKLPKCLYVGSTPNPRRRLKQHNGISKGGAKRTGAKSKRPWAMVALVTGFPSKIAALQFEWAWQNTHLTRHIPREDRISDYEVKDKISKNGLPYQKPGRVIDEMEDKIRNLQILLRAVSFRRWPLKVRFFSKDVYDQWNQKSIEGQLCIKDGIEAMLDPSALQTLEKPRKKSKAAHLSEFDTWPTTKAIYAIDETYDPFKQQLQHSLTVLKDAAKLDCAICSKKLFPEQDMIMICTNGNCSATSHMLCLAKTFLSRDSNLDSLLPVGGHCPCCSVQLQWVDLVRDTTLRTRGVERLRKMLKKNPLEARDTTLQTPTEATPASKAESSAHEGLRGLNALGTQLEDCDSDDEINYDASFAEISPKEVVETELPTDNGSEDDLPLMQKRSKRPRSPDRKGPKLSLGVIPDSEGWNYIEEFG